MGKSFNEFSKFALHIRIYTKENYQNVRNTVPRTLRRKRLTLKTIHEDKEYGDTFTNCLTSHLTVHVRSQTIDKPYEYRELRL